MGSDKPKIGRPPKRPEDKYLTKARQLGRIPDEEWDEMQSAASEAGESFTAWARGVLLRAARRSRK